MKRLISLFLVAVLLATTFIIPVSADDEMFWAEGEYDVSEADGNITPHHAWGYVFTLDTINSMTGNTTALFTDAAAYANVGKWSSKAVFAPTEEENVYVLVAAYKITSQKGQADIDAGIVDFSKGQIVLVAQDSGTRPEKNEDGSLKFPNWEERAAIWGLVNTPGAKVTLAGIDVEAGTMENGTITVEDDPSKVEQKSVEEEMKEALGEAFEDAMLDFDIEAPETYKAGDEITVTVTVKNIIAENGIHAINFTLYYDNENLVLTNDLDENYDNAVVCINNLPKKWENLTHVANDYNPDNAEGTEVNPINDGVIYVNVFTAYVENTDAVTEDGALVLEFTFRALEDSEGDIGLVIPNAEAEGAFNGEAGAIIYNANGDYAVIRRDDSTGPVEPDEPVVESTNVALGKDYVISGIGNRESYYGNVTDGIVPESLSGNMNAEWFGFYHNNNNSISNAPDKVGYFIIDLENAYYLTSVRTNLITKSSWGISAPKAVNAYVSYDGYDYKEVGTFELSDVDGTSYWTEIELACVARYVKVEFILAGTFAFVSEVEVYGVESTEAPVEPEVPGLPSNITPWGAGIEVMTDGYTGFEITGWEGNQDKLMGFGNSILDATTYSFTVTVNEYSFDRLALLALDYEIGGVMLPEAVRFLINGIEYEAEIYPSPNSIALIEAVFDESITASEITVIVEMGASPYTFGIFNMFSELEFHEYEPEPEPDEPTPDEPTPDEPNDDMFWVTHYDNGNVEGAGVIFTETDKAGAFWTHVAFAPVAGLSSVYEVVETKLGDGTAFAIDIPDGGFVYATNIGNNWPELFEQYGANGDGSTGLWFDNAEYAAYPNFMSAAAQAACAKANAMKVGDKYVIKGIDLVNKTIPTATPDKMWYEEGYICTATIQAYVPGMEFPDEPENPDVVELKVSHVNAYNWGTFEAMIITGDGKTVEDVIGQKPIWWIVYTVENIDGKYVATNFFANSEDCYKVTVPTGGFLFYVYNANSAYAAAGDGALLGYTFVVDGLKLDGVTAIDTTLNPAKLIYAYAPGVPDEPDVPATDKLTIELSDNDAILNKTVDEAVALLTDGDFALNAEAWGGNTNGVVVFQNKNATNASASGQINLIWEFAETPEPYNTIKLGLYSDVNCMIGYPTEDDVYFSNDGVNWVGGYSNASIGYGETIPNEKITSTINGVSAGTIIAEIKLRNPQTYKYVKVELYFPKSPFTEANGYTGGTAKPRWEFFGLTEIAFDYVEPSSVITDFNSADYWESRYGRSGGSFAYTNADAYEVAYDNFIGKSYTQVAFAPVAGVKNTYEVVAKGTGAEAFDFPENGFVWVAYSTASAGSYGKAALDLFATMNVGDQYTFNGIDFEKGFGEKDATVVKYEAPDEPNVPGNNNVALNKDYTISGCGTPFGQYTANLTDGRAADQLTYNDNWFAFMGNGSDESKINAPDKLGVITIDLQNMYLVDTVRINTFMGNTSGIAAPEYITIEVSKDGEEFYEVQTQWFEVASDNIVEWLEFYFDQEIEASYVRVSIKLRNPFAFINEIEVYGVESTDEPAPDEPDEPTPDEPIVSGTNIALGKPYTTNEQFRQGGWEANWGYDPNAPIVYPDEDGITLTDGKLPADDAEYIAEEWAAWNHTHPDYYYVGYNYITIDLGEKYDLSKFVLWYGTSALSSGIGASNMTVEVYVSDNGIDWVQAGETAIPADDTSSVNECVVIEDNVSAQYVEFRIARGGWVFLSEAEVYTAGAEQPDEPDEPATSLEEQLKAALGEAFADAKLDYVIDAPLSYKAGDEITVTVTVKNITAENGIHVAAFKLFYDNGKLLLINDLDEDDDNALMCVKTMPNGWENFCRVVNDYDPDNEEGTEVKPINDGVIYAQIFTTKTTKSAAAKEDGSIVFEFTFIALEDSDGDIGIVIPHAETEGAYNTATGEDIYTANGDYAIIHDAVVVEGYDATCETDGLTDGLYCADCDTWLIAQEVIKAPGHSYNATVTDPTCTEQGYTTYVCHCGDTYVGDYVKALGHDYKTTVTDPTCTEQGYTTYVCHCGDTYVADYVDALGHDDGEWVTVIEPDVNKEGYAELRCTVCGEVLDTKVLPMLCKLGDVNNNGEIDIYDYIFTKRAVMGTLVLDNVQEKAADVNRNGAVEKYDYILIKRHFMELYVIEGAE